MFDPHRVRLEFYDFEDDETIQARLLRSWLSKTKQQHERKNRMSVLKKLNDPCANCARESIKNASTRLTRIEALLLPIIS